MRLRDISIGKKLFLGLSIILFFVIGLGWIAYYQSNKLWHHTEDLFVHPFQVSKVSRQIKSNIQFIRINMLEFNSEANSANINTYLRRIDSIAVENGKLFDTLKDRYLGPRDDIDSVITAFNYYKAICLETINIKKNGNEELASQRILSTGLGGRQEALTIKQINTIIDFSNNKAEEFYTSTRKDSNSLINQLIVLVIFIIGLAILIGIHLISSIRIPLRILGKAADDYAKGAYSSRSSYVSGNEFGKLSFTFNKLATSVQKAILLSEDSAIIAEEILKENDIEKFGYSMLNILCQKTKSQIGALYLLDESKSAFQLQASIGLSKEAETSLTLKSYEGESGSVLITRQLIILSDIPPDTAFIFKTTSGNFMPKEIMTIPVLDDNKVIAIISLSSIYLYSDEAKKLMNEVWDLLNVRISGIILYHKLIQYSKQLDEQNYLINEKSRELTSQADELKEYTLELELQKKQLKEANELKSSFLSNMSHELRTPLNAVIALSGVLNKRLRNNIPGEEYRYIDIIQKNGKHLLALINDILDLSKIEAGKETVSFSQFSLQETLDSILASLENQVKEKHLDISLKFSKDFPILFNDSSKIYHILQNIIGNAVKFTEKGSVEISSLLFNSNFIVHVSDTGIGIEEDKISYIFDEFRQADDKNTKKYGGTGLGLAIAKKYCELLGGKIQVESTFGQGSTFSIIIPLQEHNGCNDTETDFPNGTSDIYSNQYIKNKSILIIEDSEPAIIQLSEILKESQLNIHVARNGLKALEYMKIMTPDAIILDLMMPEMDGFQVITTLRNSTKTAKIPVLILTAKQITAEELSVLKENNIFQLIQKGDINKHELIKHVKNMLSITIKPIIPVKPREIDKPLILIIDNNSDNIETAKALLQTDYSVLEAATAKEGIEKIRTQSPNLVLLDINLPDMDGVETLNLIREIPAFGTIPIIAYTANAMTGAEDDYLAKGFDGYLSKPIDIDTFEESIRKWLKH